MILIQTELELIEVLIHCSKADSGNPWIDIHVKLDTLFDSILPLIGRIVYKSKAGNGPYVSYKFTSIRHYPWVKQVDQAAISILRSITEDNIDSKLVEMQLRGMIQ